MNWTTVKDAWRILRRERTMPTSTPADNDLLICELQHRIDELLADNDSLQERLWAMNVALIAMAEKISELENVT